MSHNPYAAPGSQELGYAGAPTRTVSFSALLGQVMFLVAVAIGVAALGAYVGRELADGTSLAIFFVGIGMLLVQNFVGALRHGALGIFWLYASALALGLGLGPTMQEYLSVDPASVYYAAGGTAATVALTGCIGVAISKDLSPLFRPLSIIGIVLFAVVLVLMIASSPISPIISMAIYAFSTVVLVVDFNFLRKKATEDDVIWIATSIFVSILNIFLSLLNIFSSD